MPTRRAALYTRVSSAGQVDNYSLDFQEMQLREYCERHRIEVAGVYQDAGVSGSTLVDRPAIRQLIEDAKAGKFSEVLIYRVDRFTRADPWDLYPLIKGLIDLDVKLTSTTESFDLTDDDGQLIFSILANFAARERRSIIQRTLSGKRATAREGRYTGGKVPFGYDVDPDTGRLTPDDTPWWNGYSKAETVRRIFEWYLELHSTAKVAGLLIEYGVPAPESQWNATGVWSIIRNPVYKGDFAWGKRSHRLNEPSRVNSPEDWIVCEDAHPGIVAKDMWERCAGLMRNNRRGGRRPVRQIRLLDGFLECIHCGSTLTPRSSGPKNNYYYYTCASRYNQARRRDGTACLDAKSWNGKVLADRVWNRIASMICSGELVDKMREETSHGKSLLQKAIADMKDAYRHLNEVQKKEQRLLDLALTGGFSNEVLQQKQVQLKKERETAKEAVKQARARLESIRHHFPTEADLQNMQQRLLDALHKMTATEDKRAILKLILDGRIVITDDGDVQIRIRPALGT